jgi:opacity protein-like surface antigen
MKKLALCLMLAVASLSVAIFPATAAPIIVPGYGETGWQTYSHEFTSDWRGTFGIGVSNYGDMEMDSKLLVGNLNIGPPGNTRFETGAFTGYAVYGDNNAVISQAISYNGSIYMPTKGSYMASIFSSYSIDDSGGTYYVDTSEWGGTNGSYITFPLDVLGGTMLTFDWAFLAGDEYPNADFAFVYGQPQCGGPVLTSCETLFGARPVLSDSGSCSEPYFERIAEIGETVPVSEPATVMLLVCSLIGLAGFGKKIRGLPAGPYSS